MGLKCQIVLSKSDSKVYRSGEIVIGVIRYSIEKATKFEFINVSLRGKGKCWWTEPTGDSSDSSTFDSYSGKEDYVSLHHTVLQRTENPIIAGVYELPFQFQLPLDLPSSYTDSICKIKYKIIAVFSKSGFLGGTKKIDTEILVYGNVKPCSPQPLIFGLTKSPFTAKKPVNLNIEIEKTLLLPGENITLTCLIKNFTKIPIVSIQTKLITQVTYISDSRYKKTQRKVVDQSDGESPGIKGNSVARLICIVPTFPNLYSIQNSKILLREYKVNVTVKFPFPHRDAAIEIPVVIGDGNVFGVDIINELKSDADWKSMSMVREF